jgi:apolipoprotein N-acyltransferase
MTQKLLPRVVAFAASGVMLTVIQAPISWSALAWVSLVPFVLACSPAARVVPLVLAAYLVSLCYWLGNLYWMEPVTRSGWLAFCLYTALLWPMLVICLRYCRIKKIPLFLAVPVLFVGAERLQGLFLGGFFWRFLAHSLYHKLEFIQIADIFGAAGVSFLIGMVNGLFAEALIDDSEKNDFRASGLLEIVLKASLVGAVLGAAVVYGRWRIGQSGEFVEAGPLVAAVQSNVPQSVKQSFQAEDEIFEDLLRQSKESAQAGAELIAWPETMVQAILEPAVLRLLDSSHSYKVFDKAISEHSKERAFVLVGAYGGTPRVEENFDIRLAQKYNSAFLYKPDGRQANEQYGKIHLVPFGEMLPFENVPFLHSLLIRMTPYDFDYTLDAGREYTVFEMGGGQESQVYKFSVMICYEDAVPVMARRFALDKQGQKRLDWLVNISNDGWFVKFKDGKVLPSTELAQHTSICVFRAIENRLAVLRSVNTGISCLIDTVGRIRDGFLAGNLPRKAMAREGVAGWFVDRVPIDKRTTFFSKYGQWLDFCCAVCFVSLIIVPVLRRFLFRKESKNMQGQPNGKYAD